MLLDDTLEIVKIPPKNNIEDFKWLLISTSLSLLPFLVEQISMTLEMMVDAI